MDSKDTDWWVKKTWTRSLFITALLLVPPHQCKLSVTWPVVDVVQRATLGGHVAQVDLLVLNLNLQVAEKTKKKKVRSSQASRHKVKSQCYDWRPLKNRGCNFILHHTGKIRWMELKTKSKDLFVPQCGELLQSMRKNRRGGSIWAKKQSFGWIYGTCGRCNTTQDEEVWWKKGSRWRER